MPADVIGAKQRWAIAAGASAVLGAVLVSIFRAPTLPVLQESPPAKTVQLKKITADRSALSEETVMRDLAPLFLPTPRNASLARIPVREPGKTFLDIEAPRLGIANAGWRFDESLPRVATLGGKRLSEVQPLDLVAEMTNSASLLGFGRDPAGIATLVPRGGVVDVVNARDGRQVFAEILQAEARPPTDRLWQPLEFMANVGPAGLVAPLTVVSRSGVDEVDAYFRNYLARTFRVGERLAPGFYRITVAP